MARPSNASLGYLQTAQIAGGVLLGIGIVLGWAVGSYQLVWGLSVGGAVLLGGGGGVLVWTESGRRLVEVMLTKVAAGDLLALRLVLAGGAAAAVAGVVMASADLADPVVGLLAGLFLAIGVSAVLLVPITLADRSSPTE